MLIPAFSTGKYSTACQPKHKPSIITAPLIFYLALAWRKKKKACDWASWEDLLGAGNAVFLSSLNNTVGEALSKSQPAPLFFKGCLAKMLHLLINAGSLNWLRLHSKTTRHSRVGVMSEHRMSHCNKSYKRQHLFFLHWTALGHEELKAGVSTREIIHMIIIHQHPIQG